MANIPVERKGGVPGWVWLLLALLAILLLFLLFGDGCGNEVADDAVLTDTTSRIIDPVPMTPTDDLDFTGAPDIADVPLLFTRAGEGSIVGRTVRLDDVVAMEVTGDSAFYVSNGADRALVVLAGMGEGQTTGGCPDGDNCVQQGDTLDIVGRVVALDDTLRGRWTVRSDAAQDYYIRARRVNG